MRGSGELGNTGEPGSKLSSGLSAIGLRSAVSCRNLSKTVSGRFSGSFFWLSLTLNPFLSLVFAFFYVKERCLFHLGLYTKIAILSMVAWVYFIESISVPRRGLEAFSFCTGFVWYSPSLWSGSVPYTQPFRALSRKARRCLAPGTKKSLRYFFVPGRGLEPPPVA